MRKLKLIIPAFCFLTLSALAQKDTLREARTEISDVYLAAGNTSFPIFTMAPDDFKKIVPDSKLLTGDYLKINFNDFSADTAGGFGVGGPKTAIYLQGGITLRLKNKEFKDAGPWIKLGFNYFESSTGLKTGIFDREVTRTDNAYFVSSMAVNRVTFNRRSLVYEYACQSANIEATLIYKLNPDGIFSLFGGPGAMVGMNFAGKAKLEEVFETNSEDFIVLPDKSELLYSANRQRTTTKEEFSFGPNISFGLFIDVGVDLRLGSTFDVIKNTHAFAEVKPLFRAYAVKGAGFQSSVLLVGNAGLRYEF